MEKHLRRRLAVMSLLVFGWLIVGMRSVSAQDGEFFVICVTQCATENGNVILGWSLLRTEQDRHGNWVVSADAIDPMPEGITFTVEHRRGGAVLERFTVRSDSLPVHLAPEHGLEGADQFWVSSDNPNDVTRKVNTSISEDALPWGFAQIVAMPQRRVRGGLIYTSLNKFGQYAADTLEKGRIIGKVLLVVFLLGMFGAVLLIWRVFWDPTIHPAILKYWRQRFREDFEAALQDLVDGRAAPQDRLGLIFGDVLRGISLEDLAARDYVGELDKLQRRLGERIQNETARLTFGVHSAFPGFLKPGRKKANQQEAEIDSRDAPKAGAATSWLFSLDSLWGLAVISPLLGLLGTVTGLSDSFRRVSQTPVGSSVPGLGGGAVGNPISVLAGGINEALYTTIAGLASGIVLIMIYYLIGYRVNKVRRLMEEAVDTFMDALAHQLEKTKRLTEKA